MLTSDDACAALAPFAALPGWLTTPLDAARLEASLRAHVPGLADGTLVLVGGAVDQIRVRGDEWLVRCEVTVATPGGEPADVVLVGPLHPPYRPDPSGPPPEASVPFGAPGWRGYLPDLRIELTVETAADDLPALEQLLDPERASRLIEHALGSTGHAGPRVATCTPQIARHKPGSRCTIAYGVTYEPPSDALPATVVAKTYLGEQGGTIDRGMRALWGTGLATSGDVTIAEPLGYDRDTHALLQAGLPGDATLKEQCHTAFETMDPSLVELMRAELGRTARGLAALHTSGADIASTTTFADELGVARQLLDVLTCAVPDMASWSEPLLGRVEAQHLAVPEGPSVSSHGSFRPAQVLVGPGAPALIDFDKATMAEPAMDVGIFLAGLRCIGVPALSKQPEGFRDDVVAARLAQLDRLGDEFVREYERHAPLDPCRVVLWETLDLFTSLLNTWTKGRVKKVVPRLAALRHQVARLSGETG